MKRRQNKKRRKTGSHSDLSDDSYDGSTTPMGYTARGKICNGGSFLDAKCSKSLSNRHCSPVTGQPGTYQQVTGQPVTSHPVTSQLDTDQPGTRQVFTGQQITGQQMTSHWSSSHRSSSDYTGQLIARHQSTVTSQLTRHRSSHIRSLIRMTG